MKFQPKTYIVELGQDEVNIIAQMLHICLTKDPNHSTAASALESLRQQADGVHLEAEKHNVYDRHNAPARANMFQGVYYVPISRPKKVKEDLPL